METIFTNKILYYAIIIVIKILYAVTIYFKCNCGSKRTRNVLTYLSFPFPIITGIICITKYKKKSKDTIIVLAMLIFSLVSTVGVGVAYTYYGDNESSVIYYDKDGTAHSYAFEVSFEDREGNKYTFDFDKSAYQLLYINSTDEYLNADLCYLDENGYLHYDDDFSITAVTGTSYCVDVDGSIYYPARSDSFNKDGTINDSHIINNLTYDRLGKAYTYDYVPYYDIDGNRYYYYYDLTKKGLFINISTKKSYSSQYSFVDENGYLVYDSKHSFVEKKNAEHEGTYVDENGKTYYMATYVKWDEQGRLTDYTGKLI